MSLLSALSTLINQIGVDYKFLKSLGVPLGGSTGQVLTKKSATDNDVWWQTPASGAGAFPVITTASAFAGSTVDWLYFDSSLWKRIAGQVDTNLENNGKYTATQYNATSGFRYERQFEGPAFFRWWARASGDQHSRLRFAMASGYAEVRVEDGTYDFYDVAWAGGNFNLTGNVNDPSKVIFNCKGAETRVIRGWFWYDGLSAGQIFENIRIQGITFNQMSTADVRSQFNGTGSSYGPISFEGASTRNLKVFDCIYNQISTTAITNFIFVKPGANRLIADIYIRRIKSVKNTVRSRMLFEAINQEHPASDQVQGYNIQVNDNELDNFRYGISVAGNFRDTKLDDNLVGSCSDYGIELAGNNLNSSTSFNRFYGIHNVLWTSNYHGETGAAGGDYPITGGQRYVGNQTLGFVPGYVEIRGAGEMAFNDNILNIDGGILLKKINLGGVTGGQLKGNRVVSTMANTNWRNVTTALVFYEGASGVLATENYFERGGTDTTALIRVDGALATGNHFAFNTFKKNAQGAYFSTLQTTITRFQNESETGIALEATTAASEVPFSGAVNLIYDGDSVVWGNGSSHTASNEDDFTGANFPAVSRAQLVAAFPLATFRTKNFGVNGQTTPNMTADAVTQVDSLYHSFNYKRNILVVRPGVGNDIGTNNIDGVTAFNNVVTYCKARRERGWKVIVITITDRSVAPSGMTVAEYNSRKNVTNDLMRTNFNLFADGLVDFASVTGLSFPDGIHTNDAGYAILANMVYEQASTLIKIGYNSQASAPGGSGSTTPTTPTASANILTLSGTGPNGSTDVVDSSPYARAVTNNGVTISTAQSKYGGSSLFFNNSDAIFLTLPAHADFNFGTGDFTLECWFYALTWPTTVSPLFTRSDLTNVQWSFNVRANGASTALNVRNADNAGYASPGPSNSVAAPSLNAWHHFAVVSTAGSRKLYIDGVLSATSSAMPSMELNPNPAPLNVGRLQAGDKLNGYYHGRITKSALYTANFTPPSSFDAAPTPGRLDSSKIPFALS